MLGINKTLPIRTLGDKVLGTVAKPVEAINDELIDLAEKMVRTMYKADGVGLAAPQVGVSLRMFVLHVPNPEDEDGNPLPPGTPGEAVLLPKMPVALVNPEVIPCGTETETHEEGCLSVPKLYAEVTRPARVIIRATLISGEKIDLECGGLLARAIQHENDHLDGIVFVQKAEEKSLSRIHSGIQALLKKTGRSHFKIKRIGK